VGNLEGSNGPRRVVQSLWSGAAAAVHRLACPQPVSGRVESNERVPVTGVVGMFIITTRRSPARDQRARWVRRTTDRVLRVPHADKRLRNRRIVVVPGNASRMLDIRR